jgi:arginase
MTGLQLLDTRLLGVPFNSSGRADGVTRAPAALRRAGLLDALAATGAVVDDAGDVDVDLVDDHRDVASHVIAPLALAAMVRETREMVRALLGDGRLPIVVGGDCPILMGCLGATPKPPGLFFVDGHEDAWPPAASTTGEAADMELGFLLGRNLDSLPDRLRRQIPHLQPDQVVVLGARDASELADAGVPSIARDVRVVTPDSIRSGPTEVGRGSADQVAGGGSWWLHVDLDVLATESLPAVDYPQAGGLDWDDLTALTLGALTVPGLVGVDVTIYNPDLDPLGSAATRIVRYLADALASVATIARNPGPAMKESDS